MRDRAQTYDNIIFDENGELKTGSDILKWGK